MTRVKICGITNVADAVLCHEAGAHLLGVVLTTSPRQIAPIDAAAIRAAVPGARLVGVVRDAEALDLAAIARESRVDILQLHDCPDPDRWDAVAAASGLPVLPAVTVEHADNAVEAVLARPGRALVGLLLDLPKGAASNPAARERLWTAARRSRERGVPVVLAGSLAAADVPAAVARVAPAMLDVCRGTERSPGLKEPDRVRRFLAAAGTVEVNRAQ